MRTFLGEFRAFAVRGNVIDLAVAVVIGGAFGKIVSSLVENIVMPFVGVFLGGLNFDQLSYSAGEANVTYGVFLQSIVDFLIIAFVIFMVVRTINKLADKEEEELKEETPAEPTEDIKLLREIRDSLQK